MFTVTRLHGTDEQALILNSDFADLRPFFPLSADRGAPNRFSFAIADAGDWNEHCHQIAEALEVLSLAITRARELGFKVEIDIAIEPDDYASRILTTCSFSNELLSILHAQQIAVVLSIYGSALKRVERAESG